MLDTNVLVKVCHPTAYRDVQEWLHGLLTRAGGAPEIMISVLVDYEYRRGLLAANAVDGLRHLDELERSVRLVPVTVEASRMAADLRHRLGGRARPSDADLLIAAQAELEGAILVTSDKALHSVPGLHSRDWNEIGVD